ncbi:Facilitated trehalose transporter Tret1 [Eumeta japonica]|uniref:Facilitated trehalose transporter Tret1 n=1 Tax=Eumeta variegata TaxID=151549 RepID=A0A4C1VQ73_EUMVA|nr:Facilitated trehalose transporter Tret1 [Eumeta japonica]
MAGTSPEYLVMLKWFFSQSESSWVVALVTAGALPGCMMGHYLAETLGRKKTIFVSALPAFVAGTIILLASVSWLLFIARFLQGCSTGIIAVVTMIYITEIADKDIRGALGMIVQVMNNQGSLLMYCVGPFVSYRVLSSLIMAIPVVYVAACLWIPESPYYHLKDGRVESARKEFMVLKGTNDEKWADEQLEVVRAHVQQSMENKTTVKELFTNMRYRKAVYIIAGLKVLQYMTGALAIQSYLEMIFMESSSISGRSASIIYGVGGATGAQAQGVNSGGRKNGQTRQDYYFFGSLLMSSRCAPSALDSNTYVPTCQYHQKRVLAALLADRLGRRILMLISSLGVGMSLTLVGAYFFTKNFVMANESTLNAIKFLPLAGIIGFNILYAIGIGNIPYVMQAELFPINVKAAASSAATMSACVFSFTVAKCYQGVKDAFGHYTVFWSYATVAYLGIFFVYFCVPETKGKTLEEVQDNLQAERYEAETERLNATTAEVENESEKK